MAMFGWGLSDDWLWSLMAAISIPVVFMSIWGVFAVPNDRSRSGNAPIPIPGPLRFVLELAIFSFSIWCLIEIDKAVLGMILGGLVVLHYGLSIERITWLLFNHAKS